MVIPPCVKGYEISRLQDGLPAEDTKGVGRLDPLSHLKYRRRTEIRGFSSGTKKPPKGWQMPLGGFL